MYTIVTSDVNDALYKGITYLLREGVVERSRNGPVLVAPGPVVTEYTRPRWRVLYSPTRDANPVFHFMESLWMLSGSNDIAFVKYFAKNMSLFSDDGITAWGAYGWRWRKFFGWDQLEAIVEELKRTPASRRCVLAMWNAMSQLYGSTEETQDVEWTDTAISEDFHVATHGGKDVPCNTHVYFDARGGRINMTVCNRSNDIIWGCYGANAVHMSFLQEYTAMRVGLPIGVYRQFSNNYHVYTDVFSRAKLKMIAQESDTLGRLPALGPAIEHGFDNDLSLFMTWARACINNTHGMKIPVWKTALFKTVAEPMFLVWRMRKMMKEGHADASLDGRTVAGELERIAAPDWKRACAEWIERRRHKG
jgi:thymidylate synthase